MALGSEFDVTVLMWCAQVVIMLLVLLFVFTGCWLPLQISILYSEHRQEIASDVNIFRSIVYCAYHTWLLLGAWGTSTQISCV